MMKAKITTTAVPGGFSYLAEIDDSPVSWEARGQAATEPKAVVLAQLAIRQRYSERMHQVAPETLSEPPKAADKFNLDNI